MKAGDTLSRHLGDANAYMRSQAARVSFELIHSNGADLDRAKLRIGICPSMDRCNQAEAETTMTSPSAPLILIVEDFDDAREMYRDYLEFSGFRVVTARDGREAIEQARATRPDLILMDLSLPGIDGWEATRLLKADPATRHLMIVALSAHALAPEGDRAREAGCDGFIAKPCLPPDLVVHIAAYLKLHAQRGGRARRPRAHRP